MKIQYAFDMASDQWFIRVAIPLDELRLKHEKQLEPLVEVLRADIEKFIAAKKVKLELVRGRED